MSAPQLKHSAMTSRLLTQYGCGPIRFSGENDASYERHLLLFDDVSPSKPRAPPSASRLPRAGWRDVLSLAHCGKFSSDYTVAQYAAEIWQAKPCPVPLSGGYSRHEANTHLRRNHGIVASFSRALVEGLSAKQSSAEFDSTLDEAIQSIFEASSPPAQSR